MASRSYTSRREMVEYSFHPLVTLLVPLLGILLGAYLPKLFPRLAILDLPLIIVVFFAVARRSPISGTLTGAVVGLLQDSLSNQPIGVNGMVKALVGYIAASVGLNVNVDSLTTRLVMNFGFSMLGSALIFLIERRLLGFTAYHVMWLHELLRATVNTLVAIPVFLLLDRTKINEN